MNYTLRLMDHITDEVGVSDDARMAFKSGYMSSLIEDLILRLPEAKEIVESHARKYKYEGN